MPAVTKERVEAHHIITTIYLTEEVTYLECRVFLKMNLDFMNYQMQGENGL